MLKVLRKNTKTIIWIVIAGFAIWGGGSLALEGKSRFGVAGTIFGRNVKYAEFMRAGKSIRLLTAVGQDTNITSDQLDAETWRHLILVHEAKKRGYQVSNQEVTQQIKSFFGTGQTFDDERYKLWVRNVFGDQPRQFEEEMRNFLSVKKLVDTFRPTLEPTDDEIWVWYKGFFLKPNDDGTIEDEEGKRQKFQESIDQWRSTFISFKENEAFGNAIQEIETRAALKSYLPTAEPVPSSTDPVPSEVIELNTSEPEAIATEAETESAGNPSIETDGEKQKEGVK